MAAAQPLDYRVLRRRDSERDTTELLSGAPKTFYIGRKRPAECVLVGARPARYGRAAWHSRTWFSVDDSQIELALLCCWARKHLGARLFASAIPAKIDIQEDEQR